jgi:hypothetical protein
MNLFFVWFWLTIGNVAYQVFGAHDWSAAFDRTYFQGIAILGVWFVAKMQALALSSPHGAST